MATKATLLEKQATIAELERKLADIRSHTGMVTGCRMLLAGWLSVCHSDYEIHMKRLAFEEQLQKQKQEYEELRKQDAQKYHYPLPSSP